MKYLLNVLLILIILGVMTGCRRPIITHIEKPPAYWPTQGWRTSTPEAQGIDSDQLVNIVKLILEQDLNLHSMLIVRNGYVVSDIYFYPYLGNTVHDVASVTKSITSALIGIAIAKGFIPDKNAPILDFFPQHKARCVNNAKEKLLLKHLLTMTSGLNCVREDPDVSPFREATLFEMFESEDWVRFILDLPVVSEPGSTFDYNSCNFHLLSAIIKETTGMNALDFAQKYLFNPLGIQEAIWPADPQGNNHGWGDLKLHPHDIAKIGFLYLHNGVWENQQILLPDWIEKSALAQAKLPGNETFHYDYSYGWWVISGSIRGVYEANGRGGQYIIIWPKQNLVIVFTGGGFDIGAITPQLIATVKSEHSLPENSEAYNRLQKLTAEASNPPDAKPSLPLPDVTWEISGKTWKLDKNPLGLESVVVSFEDQNNGTIAIKGDIFDQILTIRLDNVYAISPNGRFSLPVAAKGYW